MTGGLIASLDSQGDSLEVVGGKGRSLAKLINAGFNVPGGFQVTTHAYRSFVADHHLHAKILELAKPQVVEGSASFAQASGDITRLFLDCALSEETAQAIRDAYAGLAAAPAVAIRSSANAEDLPDLSFAGQQDTYLNVRGPDAVADAVKRCWASLWTAQAINYRHEMGIGQDTVAMAVVVQVMVASEVAGIAFTANPATGNRDEIIINCSFGLGEAVVSGQVTPDTFVVDRQSIKVKEAVVGTKSRMIVPDGEHGTRLADVAEDQKLQLSLADTGLTELATVALRIEEEFGGIPQDIEWAIASGRLWMLQSRPITNLPVPPPGEVTWPGIADAQLLKRQVAENMPEPLSPLFQDLYLKGLFDSQHWPEGWQWKGIHTRNWMKNFVVTTVNGYAYQPIYRSGAGEWKGHMDKLKQTQQSQPWYKTLKGALSNKYFIDELKGGPFHFLYLIARFYRTFTRYPALKRWEAVLLPEYLAGIGRWDRSDPLVATSDELLQCLRDLSLTEAKYWHALRGVIGTAKSTDGALQTFLEENAADEGMISGTFLSGFASRTLQAESDMQAIATGIRENPALNELAAVTPAVRLIDTLRTHPEGGVTTKAIDEYLHRYGRQVFNLDFVVPSLEVAPGPFAMNLKAMVRHPGHDLETRLRNVARNRRSKMWRALKIFKGSKRLNFLQIYWTARINYPAREEALFYMGLAWSTLRPWALELGRRLVGSGTLTRADDVFYVTSEDLQAAIAAHDRGEALPALAGKAGEQRLLRAQRLRMDPPPAIPPLKDANNPLATIHSNSDASGVLKGFAVSPGKVSGVASVVMSPDDFDKMQPDSILVCPLTTPAWTQLFPHARALVTDIGSILAHGSIVAREYGIPAVLGVGDATQRIRSGDMLEIDGDRGTVRVLPPE